MIFGKEINDMKKLNNYDFTMNWYGGLTEEIFLKAIRTNNASNIFEYDKKYGDCYCLIEENKDEPEYRGIAILENGYVDIEANFYMNENSEPIIDFFICCKYGERDIDWSSDGFYHNIFWDDDLLTDFSKDDWKEQLEKEMFDKLKKYCEVKGYDYTKPINYYKY